MCGVALRDGDDAARVGAELLHAACVEPLLRDSSERRPVEVGVLNGLAAGIGAATLIAHA